MHALLLPVLLALLATAAPVTVEGVSCLDAADLNAALQGLLPEGVPREPLAVELAPSAAAFIVRVRNGTGAVIAERTLPALAPGEASCRQRAQAIAVVVAAAAVPDAPPPEVTSEPPRAKPAPPPPPSADLSARAPQGARRPFDVGASAGVSLAGGTLAPAVRVEAETPLSPSVLLRVSGLYDRAHTSDVGRGEAAWSRVGGAGALALRTRMGGSLELSAAAELDAAWRAISGRGFVETETSWSFDPGVGLDARLTRRASQFSTWLALGARAWPRTQSVFVRGIPSEGDLPRWDLFAGVGGAFMAR